ncbi:dispanin subfamily A member 2b-like protein [Labeo rohita]|uniref:Dispanin subfamily A member 2b-like protein n=1 Tax=Labeo rohita TaxID=84645 RepID=A0A498P3W2_LABRO|nr:dispanin subfamily A member 2b-like protein [Labeo rohita]RXN38905.1 dispanin subfamily A member 2b-like protein [Labeo rohita]
MQSYSAPEGIPMQDNRAYTAQSVTVSMPDQKISDDIIFSTFSLHFCNICCLGFGAFYNSIKARDSRLLGDFPKARSYGAKARCLNIAAVIFGSIVMLIFLIILVKAYILAMSALEQIRDKF